MVALNCTAAVDKAVGSYIEGKELVPKTPGDAPSSLMSSGFCPRIVLASVTFHSGLENVCG